MNSQDIKTWKSLKKDISFTREYLRNNIQIIAKKYNNVTALDFEEKYSLEILKVIALAVAAVGTFVVVVKDRLCRYKTKED
jgi:hypothetical protein